LEKDYEEFVSLSFAFMNVGSRLYCLPLKCQHLTKALSQPKQCAF